MTTISEILKNLFAAIKKVLGRDLTSNEKQDVQNSLGIQGTTFPYIYYIQSGDVAGVDANALKKVGITDVFVKVSRVSANSNYYKTFLPTVISKFKSSGIRVHAWVACFIDAAGNWVDPNTISSRNDIIATVDGIKKLSGVYGIHLDYLRYPGTAKGQTSAITSLVKTIRERTSGLVLTAAVMPEGASNAQYYGQDYAALAKYLDALVPMVYKGNYKASRDWITSATKYIVGKAPGKVVVALQTYNSDQDTTKLAVTSLNNDIEAARNGGANGIALFRYGLSNFGAATTSTNCPDNNLRKNCIGDNVKDWQHWFNENGISELAGVGSLAEDGKFGDVTEEVTKKFQEITGIFQDGIIGPVTINKRATYKPTSTGLARLKKYVDDEQNNAWQCGPSALGMALSVFDINVAENWLAQKAGTNSTNGTEPQGLINAVNAVNQTYKKDIKVWLESFDSWSKIRSYIVDNKPVILRIQSFLRSSGQHYVLLVGIDLEKNVAYLADSSYYNGERKVELGELFDRLKYVINKGYKQPILVLSK